MTPDAALTTAGARTGAGRCRVPAASLGSGRRGARRCPAGALIAVLVLIGALAGCTGASDGQSGNTPGTAAPGPSAGSATSTGTPGDTSGALPPAPSSDTSAAASTPFTSVAETTTRKPAPTPSVPKPSGTAAVGTLDDTSVRWFTALCTGLSRADTSKAHQQAGDLAGRRAAAADVFSGAAAAYRTMATELSGLGSPKIPGGADLQETLLTAAPAMADAAERGAVDVRAATDDAGVTAAIDLADDAVSEARAPLSDFAEAMAAPALAAQLEKIEACRPLFT